MDREYWLESAKKLLTGVFNNISDFDSPVIMPRLETEITYPRDPGAYLETSKEIFEGLTRSFFIAAPLINEEPDLVINNINIKDYYRAHVLKAVTRGDSLCVGWYSDLYEMTKDKNPYGPFQQTVETCALVICLWESEKYIWNTYTKAEKDLIADFLKDYAYGNTVPQNWRLFNMLDLAFLYRHGYEIDKAYMKEHAAAIAGYYAGDGWYRDGHSFDYYSCWAFNVYAPIWNLWYGYSEEPALAELFEEHSNELIKKYASFFDKDGYTNMWGRSSIYRFAAVSAFPANMLLRNHGTEYGLYRHVCTGSLRQFMERDDFIGSNGIPTIGFYRQFSPLVQSYSCAESVFWIGKAFTCLHLPKEHPFWTAEYNDSMWSEDEPVVNTFNAPGLCTANFPANGETVLRSGKVLKTHSDIHGMYNYSKMVYNTKYPWEACDYSQMYVLNELSEERLKYPNVTFWCGEKEGVLYRRQYFGFNLENERHWIQGIALSDFTVDYGIMRADRLKLFKKPVEIKLGAYGFPDNGTEIIRKHSKLAGRDCHAVIFKGTDSQGNKRQMAFTVYEGFSDITVEEMANTNPDSEKSFVPWAVIREDAQNRYEQQLLVSQTITRDDGIDFTDDEIFPIEEIVYTDPDRFGGYGPVSIRLKNGKTYDIDFEGMDGNTAV